jgi:hypothetical protein
MIAMIFFNQGLLEKFQSKSAENFSGKVWLQKVKQVYIRLVSCPPSEHCPGILLFNQGLLKIFQSRCD